MLYFQWSDGIGVYSCTCMWCIYLVRYTFSGQTGSGKTFTMIGPSGNMDNFQHKMRGVIPRSFEYLFNLIKEQQEQVAKYRLPSNYQEVRPC